MNNFLVGGVERLLLDILTHLERKKFDITVITVLGSGPWEEKYRRSGAKIVFAGPSRVFQPTFFWKMTWLIFSPLVFLELLISLWTIRPDAVITSLTEADILGILAAYLADVKKRIVIQHDIHKLQGLKKVLKSSLALALSTRIVANSAAVERFLMGTFNISKNKIVLISNGVDLEHLKKGIRKMGREVVIGMIGRLEEIKGPRYLMEALRILKDKSRLEPKTIIAGDGGLLSELKNYARVNRLRNVKFLGLVKDPVMFLKQIDILVVPSLEEGFGLAALEGLAACKIVVASDLPAVREFIHDGQNGLLFKKEDKIKLDRHLEHLLTNPVFLKHLRTKATQWFRQEGSRWDIANVARAYENLL